jgi:hypothetical protein
LGRDFLISTSWVAGIIRMSHCTHSLLFNFWDVCVSRIKRQITWFPFQSVCSLWITFQLVIQYQIHRLFWSSGGLMCFALASVLRLFWSLCSLSIPYLKYLGTELFRIWGFFFRICIICIHIMKYCVGPKCKYKIDLCSYTSYTHGLKCVLSSIFFLYWSCVLTAVCHMRWCSVEFSSCGNLKLKKFQILEHFKFSY